MNDTYLVARFSPSPLGEGRDEGLGCAIVAAEFLL